MAFPSTFLDLQNAVIVKARLDPVNDLPKVKDWLNQVYTQVCVETEAVVTFATMNLIAGTASYTFPTGVARIKTMFVTPAGATSVLQQPPMTRTTLDDILVRRQTGGATQQGSLYCSRYAVVGINDFEVWPTPAAVDVLTVYYAGFPTPLAAATDVPIIEEPYASKLLEYGALAQAGDFKGDPATTEWAGELDQWMGRYLNHLDKKQGDIPAQYRQWGSLDDTKGLYYGGW